jgi:hypothetical protein
MKFRLAALFLSIAVCAPLFAGTPSNAFTLPVVAFLESGSQSYLTPVRITNLRPDAAQAVRVEWLDALGQHTNRNAEIITILPKESRFLPLFTFDIFPPTGLALGAVHFVAVKPDGSPDPDAQIDGVETLRKGLGPEMGEVRQTFEAIHDRDLSQTNDVVRFIDGTFNIGEHVNLAIVNLDFNAPATIAIDVANFDATGRTSTQVTVAPGSLTLVPVQASFRGLADVYVHRITRSDAPWTVVASGVDDHSGGIYTLQRLDPQLINF